ncbi:cbb3-type cytochrome c oxidase subunit I [Streptomyces sp. bgisy154]|uniref:cbb3-type cytochrome c oxidase subunit I n=1 Tax=Streptomyces sp. bgisy154 TaxID=3413794 RepID=UPI003D71C670
MTVAPPASDQEDTGGRPVRPSGWLGWVATTDHKRIGLILGTSLAMLLLVGVIALVMRSQLALAERDLIDAHTYNQLFTIHGSGTIYLVVTPFALGMGVYLVPVQIGAPGIAMPRLTLSPPRTSRL